jgi:DNA polymerase III epsilon subunit-like protein
MRGFVVYFQIFVRRTLFFFLFLSSLNAADIRDSFCRMDLDQQVKEVDISRYLNNNPIRVFCNVQTTGLDIDSDRIIEMSFIKTNYQTKEEQYLHLLFNPEGRKSCPKAFEMHGIKDEDLIGYPTFEGQSFNILKFIQGHTLVGHYVKFIYEMIHAEFRRAKNIK